MARGEKVEDFLDNFLKKLKFRDTYAEIINPILDPMTWPQIDNDPFHLPDINKRAKRPRGGKKEGN